MSAIIIIGITLFICSSAAIWVTLRASADADRWRNALRKRSKSPQKEDPPKGRRKNSGPLADRRHLEENARKLEGSTFFF